MTSTQLFSGNWRVEVFSKVADFSERFIISGSVASDGIFAGETTTPPLLVSGTRWFIRFEWNNNVGSGWQPSNLRRTGASFTVQEGLVTFIGADDNFEALRDHDFDDLVLRCRNVDPDVNPRIPLTTPLDVPLPDDVTGMGRVFGPMEGGGLTSSQALFGVAFPDVRHGWVVGASGTILTVRGS